LSYIVVLKFHHFSTLQKAAVTSVDVHSLFF